MRRLHRLTFLSVLLLAAPAAAQSSGAEADAARPGTSLAEVSAGYTAFLDDGVLDHIGTGGALRVHLTPRISVGPELSYQAGPGDDTDLMLFGVATFDIRRARIGRPGRVEPYLLAGAGLLIHSGSYGSSTSRTVTWGGGTRVWVSRRVYVGGDVRMGLAPHVRVLGTVGVVPR
jgi:hypothetical protein